MTASARSRVLTLTDYRKEKENICVQANLVTMIKKAFEYKRGFPFHIFYPLKRSKFGIISGEEPRNSERGGRLRYYFVY